MSALVSVIMAAYNAAEYMRESIDSILSQTFTNWELIIIDDGSTDNTANISREYELADKRIKYFYQQNSKQGKARNLGIQKSTGDLLAFLDTDDLWLPEKLKVSIQEFETGEQDLLFTDSYIFSASTDLVNVASLGKMNVVAGTYKGKSGLSDFLYKNRTPFLTVVVKKEAVLDVGCFRDRGLAEDYELWLNLLAAGYTLRAINTPLSLYRMHPASSTFTDRFAINGVALVLSHFFEHNPALKPIYKPQVKVWLKRYIFHNIQRGTKNISFPLVFDGFTKYIYSYNIMLTLKKILPGRLFNYLIYKLYK